MMLENDEEPKVGQEIYCRHPFQFGKRAKITPQRVEKLHKIVK